jgi:hypothetical protein
LLRQISVRWTTNEDSSAVRRILRNFGDSTDDARLADILQLSLLSERESLAALCRIARYDRSPLVSRTAAAAVIWPEIKSARKKAIDPQVIERGGVSKRGRGLAAAFDLASARPSAAVAAWQKLVDEEAAVLARGTGETNAGGQQLAVEPGRLATATEQHAGCLASCGSNDAIGERRSGQVAVAALMWLTEKVVAGG